MSIRMRILSSIVLSVFVAVACAAGIVYQQSRKDALEDFGGASREQLRLAGDYMADARRAWHHSGSVRNVHHPGS